HWQAVAYQLRGGYTSFGASCGPVPRDPKGIDRLGFGDFVKGADGVITARAELVRLELAGQEPIDVRPVVAFGAGSSLPPSRPPTRCGCAPSPSTTATASSPCGGPAIRGPGGGELRTTSWLVPSGGSHRMGEPAKATCSDRLQAKFRGLLHVCPVFLCGSQDS